MDFLLEDRLLERRELAELAHAIVNLARRQAVEPLDAEPLDRERSHRGAVDHCAPQMHGIARVGTGEAAEEPAGERVARTGRIEHLLERIAGREKDEVLREQDRAVLT